MLHFREILGTAEVFINGEGPVAAHSGHGELKVHLPANLSGQVLVSVLLKNIPGKRETGIAGHVLLVQG